MSKELDIRRAAHGGASLAILAAFLCAAAAVAWTAQAALAGKLGALEARRESAAALEARIEAFRTATRERLGSIGAFEKDALIVASPDEMRAKLSDICAALSQQQIGAACAVEEAPLTPSLASYRATIKANGEVPAVTDALVAAATPPVRLADFNLRPGAGGTVEFAATLEIAGARELSEAE
jgi:hypothetical protein